MDTTATNPPAPDWATLGFELSCPLCRYNLRGLSEPRCPECGYRFTWKELLDIHDQEHPFAFDSTYRPKAINILCTLSASFRPGRFWSSLQPGHPLRGRRLVVYLLLMWLPLLSYAGVCLGWGLPSAAMGCWNEWAEIRKIRAGAVAMAKQNPTWAAYFKNRFGGVEGYVRAIHPGSPSLTKYWPQTWPPQLPAELLATTSLLAFLPALLIFQYSMRRKGIRWGHVLRCVAYSSGIVWMLGMTVVAVGIADWYMRSPSVDLWWIFGPISELVTHKRTTTAVAVLHHGTLLAILIMGWPLFAAYRHYMRLERALAAVLSTQIMVLLLWMIIELRAMG